MSKELLAAIERGELSLEQLRELIRVEAAELGLSFDEAIRMAQEGDLPHSATGSDLRLLIQMLPPAVPA